MPPASCFTLGRAVQAPRLACRVVNGLRVAGAHQKGPFRARFFPVRPVRPFFSCKALGRGSSHAGKLLKDRYSQPSRHRPRPSILRRNNMLITLIINCLFVSMALAFRVFGSEVGFNGIS